MFIFAHHMAVELFGREFAPQGTFQHVCTFGMIGLVMSLSGYGAWSLVRKAFDGARSRQGV